MHGFSSGGMILALTNSIRPRLCSVNYQKIDVGGTCVTHDVLGSNRIIRSLCFLRGDQETLVSSLSRLATDHFTRAETILANPDSHFFLERVWCAVCYQEAQAQFKDTDWRLLAHALFHRRDWQVRQPRNCLAGEFLHVS